MRVSEVCRASFFIFFPNREDAVLGVYMHNLLLEVRKSSF